MASEKRLCERYEKELELNIDFPYDAAAKLKYTTDSQDDKKKYAGVSKNISANGLCLTTHHKLARGEHVALEVYLPKSRKPIHMDGEVRWCGHSSGRKKKELFEAGIKLSAVEGESVDQTVHLDSIHHVLWSNVLESIFGTFRKIMQNIK